LIRSFRGCTPRIAATAYVDPQAIVIGDVAISDYASVWPFAVIRGDGNSIHIGARCNIQDGTIIHIEAGQYETRLEDGIVVGHRVILHGCTVASNCLIGMGSIILNGARIGAGSVIAAGALIPEGTKVPPGSLVMGQPGKIRRKVTSNDLEAIKRGVLGYLELQQVYKAECAK